MVLTLSTTPPSVRRRASAKAIFASLHRPYGAAKPAFNMYYVYSLKCKNGFYTGCCENINERLKRYENGHAPATADRLPMGLEFYFAILNKYKAFEFKKYLKSGSGRAFIKKHLA